MNHLDRAGTRIAYALDAGSEPTIVFLPGLRSDMRGNKALALREAAAGWGHAMLRLDYRGHGVSGGRFEDGCIGDWMEDALAVIEAAAPGRVILVGSSMGGWIALLLARELGTRVAGLVGVAAAPDFTQTNILPSFTEAERATLMTQGRIDIPDTVGGPLPITRRLIEDGARHLVLDAPIPLACPVRLLQGQADRDIPWQTALTLADRIESPNLRVTFVKESGHRLSEPGELRLLIETVGELLFEAGIRAR